MIHDSQEESQAHVTLKSAVDTQRVYSEIQSKIYGGFWCLQIHSRTEKFKLLVTKSEPETLGSIVEHYTSALFDHN